MYKFITFTLWVSFLLTETRAQWFHTFKTTCLPERISFSKIAFNNSSIEVLQSTVLKCGRLSDDETMDYDDVKQSVPVFWPEACSFEINKQQSDRTDIVSSDVATFGDEACATRSSSEAKLAHLAKPAYLVEFGQLDWLTFENAGIRSFPEQFFCKFSNLTSLGLTSNALEELPQDMGLGQYSIPMKEKSQWPNPRCSCNCKLRDLLLNENYLRTLGKNFFCHFPALEKLNLANNQLESLNAEVFSCLSGLIDLLLEGNKLVRLDPGLFSSLVHLVKLTLSDNRIDEVRAGTFASQANLTLLSLDGNVIRAVADRVLSTCSSLDILDLSGNHLGDRMPNLSGLKRVVRITFARNKISDATVLSDENLPSVTTLHLESNQIKRIYRGQNRDKDGPFCRLPGLRQLTLAGNQIERIEEGAFACNPQLRELILTDNRLISLSGAFLGGVDGSFIGLDHLELQFNRLTHFSFNDIPKSLKNINVSHNFIDFLGDSNFSRIQWDNQTREYQLMTLDLSFNRLKELDLDFLIPATRTMFFTDNAIQSIVRRMHHTDGFSAPSSNTAFISDFNSNIFLQRNAIHEVCAEVLGMGQGSVSDSLQRTGRTSGATYYLAQNPLDCSCKLSQFLSTSSRSFSFRVGDLHDMTCRPVFPAAPSVRSLNETLHPSEEFLCATECLEDSGCSIRSPQYSSSLGKYNCTARCPENCSCYSDYDSRNLVMDCKAAETTPFQLGKVLPSRNVTLYVRGHVSRLMPGWWASESSIGQPFLRRLYMNGTGLEVIEIKAFLHSTLLLWTLNLEDNRLSILAPGSLDGPMQETLRELRLANNHILNLSPKLFKELINLEILTLQNNPSELDDVVLLSPSFNNGTEAEAKWKYLGVSPAVDRKCNDCDFLKKYRELVYRTSPPFQIECFDSKMDLGINGTLMIDRYRIDLCPILETKPVDMALWTGTLAALLILLVGTILAFIYRRELQIIVYIKYNWRFPNFSISRIFNRHSAPSAKLHDVFISYSCLDEEFLLHEVLPQLEPTYKVCLHHRHFQAGFTINENILKATEESSATLILLTENFLHSEWCRFEFRAAHAQMLARAGSLTERRVIIVLVGAMPKDLNLDEDLRPYVRTNTYLTWGEKHFWKKLYYWLPEPTLGFKKWIHNINVQI